jgi:hypothetical protein
MRKFIGTATALLLGTGAAFGASSVVRSVSPTTYTPGQPVTVTVVVTPDVGTRAYAMEERPPANWAVSNMQASDSSVPEFVSGIVKWGVFFDATPRTLTYTATPGAAESGTKNFSGLTSFDGVSMNTTGVTSIARAGGSGGGNPPGQSGMTETKFLTFDNILNRTNETNVLIRYSVEGAGDATLTIYDRKGQKVVDLPKGVNNGSEFTTTWDGKTKGSSVASGTYLLILQANGKVIKKNIAVIK